HLRPVVCLCERKSTELSSGQNGLPSIVESLLPTLSRFSALCYSTPPDTTSGEVSPKRNQGCRSVPNRPGNPRRRSERNLAVSPDARYAVAHWFRCTIPTAVPGVRTTSAWAASRLKCVRREAIEHSGTMHRRRVEVAAHLGQRVAFQYRHGVLAGEVEGDAV